MSSSFRSILQQVTQEKLLELLVQKDLMTKHFLPVLKKVDTSTSTTNPTESLRLLFSAVRDSPVKDTIDNVLIENLKSVLDNSEQDPSLSSQLILSWFDKLKMEIQFSLRKCEYSYLYGKLLSEWLAVEEKKRIKAEGSSEQMDTDEDLNEVSASKSAQKSKEDREKVLLTLKQLMFTSPSPQDFDSATFRQFLSKELFDFSSEVGSEKTLSEIIKETGLFFALEDSYVSTYDIQCCIKGLTTSELLSPEKKSALKELSENSEALEEVASLLTNRLKNLGRWDWPQNIESEVTQLRRGLAGEYKPFLNEDIVTALFLQYVGVKWASYFKGQFLRIYNSRIWTKLECKSGSVEQQRRDFYRNQFLSTLPDSMESQENKNEEEYAKIEGDMMEECTTLQQMPQMMRCAPQSTNFSFGAANDSIGGAALFGGGARQKRMVHPPPPKPKPDIDFKQSFLHILTTEMSLHQVIRPDKPLTVVQADLDTFGPSVIHDAALISLEFLGMSPKWLEFFRKFLQPKIRFGEDPTPSKVLRGVPSAHVLSSLLGETLLFLLDFLVNRKCNGMRIYRISDELWFWSPSQDDVTKAWVTLQTYGKMVGLKVNENRSGSTLVYSSTKDKTICGPSPLPQRNIHWGYLALSSNGVFQIDQKSINKFLEEMKTLLEKSECVLEYIQIFNKYLTFFIRNFGKSAVCCGKQHLDQIVQALRLIYEGLFGPLSPIESLKSRWTLLKEAEVVDAWAYWPLERGGLGLVNPFIGIMALRETYKEAEGVDYNSFEKLPLEDKRLWEEWKKQHEQQYGKIDQAPQVFFGAPMHPTPPKLPSWEEYIGTRETELSHWYYRYVHLLSRPGPKYPQLSDRYGTMDHHQGRNEDEGERNYFMWLFSYYETQLLMHFGSVQFINSKLLPMSMIASIQKTKVQHN